MKIEDIYDINTVSNLTLSGENITLSNVNLTLSGTSVEWTLQHFDRNGYPIDISSSVITAYIKAQTDSVYKYALISETVDSTNGIFKIIMSADTLSELGHFIHTYYVDIDGLIEFTGKLRPTQVYHNNLVSSPNRL